MFPSSFVIRLRHVEKMINADFEEALDYLCKSLCLEAYETDTARQILAEIIRSKRGLSSTELARRLGKSRGAIINQLNHLMAAGLIVKDRRYYRLRASTLASTIAEIRDDIERIMNNMMEIARALDRLEQQEF